MNVQTRHYASWLLSSLYLKLDMLLESDSDLSECLQAIEQAEKEYWSFLQPCHLCQKPTLFKDAAFSLPFCWACLQREYHFWYRAEVYARGASSSADTPTERVSSLLARHFLSEGRNSH